MLDIKRPNSSTIGEPGVRAVVEVANRWQWWLGVKAAPAQAQADLGTIPAEAADSIPAAAHLKLLDVKRIGRRMAKLSQPVMPLAFELSEAVRETSRGRVRRGVTSQAGDLNQAHQISLGQIGQVPVAAAELAKRGADKPMAGRMAGDVLASLSAQIVGEADDPARPLSADLQVR